MERDQITDKHIEEVIGLLRAHLYLKIERKGRGALVSAHELWGILEEEVDELKDAIHDNNDYAIESESYDVMISALWGLASEIVKKEKNDI